MRVTLKDYQKKLLIYLLCKHRIENLEDAHERYKVGKGDAHVLRMINHGATQEDIGVFWRSINTEHEKRITDETERKGKLLSIISGLTDQVDFVQALREHGYDESEDTMIFLLKQAGSEDFVEQQLVFDLGPEKAQLIKEGV